MSTQRALVVDDERDIRELLTITLGRMNLAVDTAANIADARRMLSQRHYELCFTDMRLPDGSGQDIIETIAAHYPDTPVAMITAYGSMDTAVEALKAGAFDFVSKPVDIKVLRQLVSTALKLSASGSEAPAGQDPDSTTESTTDGGSRFRLVGDSESMQRVRAMVGKLARNQAPVYISGESGVGKELAARLIHEQGPRAGGPFVPVNCGAIPTDLVESELFGHRKGSFTDAHADKEGLFQAANGGTLFLDEVAELPLQTQVKLLRVIQEKAVRRIGDRSETPIDVRIVSATHTDLAELVERGRFRQDLFYRINVIQLHLPPLRERREDVPQLVNVLLHRLCVRTDTPATQVSPDALAALRRYAYPGNVRELENILERALTLCENHLIGLDDLMLPGDTGQHGQLPVQQPSESPAEVAPRPGDQPLDDYMLGLEREAIMKALEKARYNKTAAARQLGITFRALRYKLKKLGID